MKRLFPSKTQLIEKIWYAKSHPIASFLSPLSWAYKRVVWLRKHYLTRFHQRSFPVPIIIVGNITVGGVGKTPLVIAMAAHFQAKGISVGIVSRGYGAKRKEFPHEVSLEKDTADDVGDEPLLMAVKTKCPIVIAPKRVQAVEHLLKRHPACQIIISDDGLQHYALGRTLEVGVVDGIRGLGNGKCLPAGPLRESKDRLNSCDLLVVNQGTWGNAFKMQLEPTEAIHIQSGETVALAQIPSPIAAMAGIGHPERFFETLRYLGLTITKYPFPDHHDFQKGELKFQETAVIMTEKDAIKCQSFAEESWYSLPVTAKLEDNFWKTLDSHLGKRLAMRGLHENT